MSCLAWTALCALIVSTPACAGIAEDPLLADAAIGSVDAPLAGDAIDASTPPADGDGSTTNATPDAEVPPAMDGGRPGEPDASTCSPCDLVSQCGCDSDTQACDLGGAHPAQGTTACRPVLVPGMVTDTCNDSTSCAAGYVCLGSQGAASCKRYCDSDAECDGGGGICVIEVTAGGTPIPGVKVCSPRCDPFTSVGCPAGWGCGPFSDPVEQRNFTWCELSGAGGQNALCSDDGQCQQGFACVQVGSSARCKRYCDRGDGVPGCGAGLSCVAIVDFAGSPLVVDGVSYGLCN